MLRMGICLNEVSIEHSLGRTLVNCHKSQMIIFAGLENKAAYKTVLKFHNYFVSLDCIPSSF